MRFEPRSEILNAMYYTYVIQSTKDHQGYTGMTADLRTRKMKSVTTEGPVRQHGGKLFLTPARAVPQSHGRKLVVRGLL